MKKHDYTFVWLIGLGLFIIHMIVIAQDVQTVLEDPNKANKPDEILKLVIDITRYLG